MEWAHERQAGKQTDKMNKMCKRGNCEGWALLRGVCATQLMVERHLATGDDRCLRRLPWELQYK